MARKVVSDLFSSAVLRLLRDSALPVATAISQHIDTILSAYPALATATDARMSTAPLRMLPALTECDRTLGAANGLWRVRAAFFTQLVDLPSWFSFGQIFVQFVPYLTKTLLSEVREKKRCAFPRLYVFVRVCMPVCVRARLYAQFARCFESGLDTSGPCR